MGGETDLKKNTEKTHNFSAPHSDAAAYESWVKTRDVIPLVVP